MSLMTNEIKCYICMISCIFIEQIFIVVYTEYMYVTLTLFNYENEKKEKKTVTFFCEYKYTVFLALL